jgi:hypothetical protein
MGQLFSRSSNSLARALVFGLFAGFFGLWGAGYAIYRSPYTTRVNIPPSQPAPFSHEHHVSGLGIDCRYCHTSVETSAFAGLPPTETCMSCHSQLWTAAPMLAPVRDSLAKDRPLRWTRVNDLPDFVFFNHSIHVKKGVGCSTCHGRVDQMPLTYKAHSLYMRWCVDCHENPASYIRPKSEVFNQSWQPPDDQPRQGQKLLIEYQIKPERLAQLKDCSMCHR